MVAIAGGIYLDPLPHALAIMAQNHGQILQNIGFSGCFVPLCQYVRIEGPNFASKLGVPSTHNHQYGTKIVFYASYHERPFTMLF